MWIVCCVRVCEECVVRQSVRSVLCEGVCGECVV